jgi:predicted flap endonuclease-1-like 5' DNA nuclease
VSQISQELSGFRPMDVQQVSAGPSRRPAEMWGSGVLLRIASSRRGRRDLAKRISSSEQKVLDWVKRADLSRVNGVDMVYSGLLAAAGVATVPDLARRNPAQLHRKLVDLNRASGLVRKLPGKRQVSSWVSQAKGLPRVITY